MKVLGMISGTSHDGIDVAVVAFVLTERVLDGRLEFTASTPYARPLRERLVRALPPAPVTFAEACALDTLIGQDFAEAAADAIAQGGPVDLICSHGQTVYHWVEARNVLGTLQIGEPAWIAERLGVPVVSNIRIRDIAAGGQGAPLVSLMDTMLLAGVPGRPAGLNLGGIANMTVLRPGVDPLVGSGGGCDTPTLIAMLVQHLPGVRLTTTAEFGAPTDTKEAIAFALLGWCTTHGLPGTVPSATGASGARILGTIQPGAGPLRLPEPLPAAPEVLRLTGAGP